MKNFLISATFLLTGIFAQAQEQITQLAEAEVKVSPYTYVEDELGNPSYMVKIKETYAGEFHEDPIAFMKNHFDMQNFLELHQSKKDDAYSVTFKTRKGTMEAEFDEKGELLGTKHKYKNIIVPEDMRHYLYKNYKGWAMVENKYAARGKGDKLGDEVYHIKFKKGNKSKRVKVVPADLRENLEVAIN